MNSLTNKNKNNYFNDESTINQTFFHTKNIGTLLYSPPEQINNNYYDFKVDIFSLGLVLYEMINPFKTNMEKNLRFSDLKKGKICGHLLNNEEVLEDLILKMCSIDPNKRPDTNKILEIIKNEISERNKKISITEKEKEIVIDIEKEKDNCNRYENNCNLFDFIDTNYINTIREEIKNMENFLNFSEDGFIYENIKNNIDYDCMFVKKFEEEKYNFSKDIKYSKIEISQNDYKINETNEKEFLNYKNCKVIFDQDLKNKKLYFIKHIFEVIKKNLQSLNNKMNFIITFVQK
jgi:serine/threonine protein kinase